MSHGVCYGGVFICIVGGLGRSLVEHSGCAVAPRTTPLMSHELYTTGHRSAARIWPDQLVDEKLAKTR